MAGLRTIMGAVDGCCDGSGAVDDGLGRRPCPGCNAGTKGQVVAGDPDAAPLLDMTRLACGCTAVDAEGTVWGPCDEHQGSLENLRSSPIVRGEDGKPRKRDTAAPSIEAMVPGDEMDPPPAGDNRTVPQPTTTEEGILFGGFCPGCGVRHTLARCPQRATKAGGVR
jgi:hypothetical protein